ncbi:MAG: rhomboid family intramembrane serine protease [Gammaproteobacteria bacterium]|nr:MAG: rhomboid family intramembrane serine protease [Gammaproteobacteria bacterium]
MLPLHDDNPTELTPYVTVGFMVLCILAFLWQLSLGGAGERAVLALGAIPAVVFEFRELHPAVAMVPDWMTVFSAMFLHGGWMHLIGNMLYLWIFGNNVEDAMGHGRFIAFYLICGVVAFLAQAVPDVHSTVPMIGASGAVSGVLGAYLLLYPRARVLVAIPLGFLIYTMRLSAGWVLGFWFVLQLFNSLLASGQQSGVAWLAHVGGFVAGMVLIPAFKRRDVRLFAPPHR